ncbi:MAG TPA: hypothetical protein VGB15_22575 [Longimicrobium sp.]|jgi:hypothetical protein
MASVETFDGGLLDSVQALLRDRLALPVRVLPPPGPADAGYDAIFSFELEGKTRELRVQAKTDISRAALADESTTGSGWLLATPELSPRLRAELRERRVNHVDLSGNVYIREPGWYVWLDADRKPPPRRQWTVRPLNPFSKKASLVLRALLENHDRGWRIRELATEARLSVGHTSDIANELLRRGYAGITNGRLTLEDSVAALRDWIGVYEWTRNQASSFVVPFTYGELGPKLQRAFSAGGLQYAFTLLSGADRIAPHVQHEQTHVYVWASHLEQAHALVRAELYGEPVATGGTLHVLKPYYGNGVFYGAAELDGTPVVSPIQLFIDLANYPLRGAEAARMLALGPLARQLGLDRKQVQELVRPLE